MTKNKAAAKKTEDQSVVYKVPAAFALMVLVIYGFWKLGGYYATLSGFSALYDLFGVLRLVLLAVLIVVCALAFVLKAPLAKTFCRYGAAALALLTVSCWILRAYWTNNMIVIYLLHALVYCLYMVWQLYRSEFFTFSLATASAGVVFYLSSRSAFALNRVLGGVLLAVILVCIALVTCLCAKNRGKLTLFGRTLRVFPEGFNSLLLYFICILWAIMLVACLIFGSGFAFYAMFAAIAIELIGAVSYTFQLK